MSGTDELAITRGGEAPSKLGLRASRGVLADEEGGAGVGHAYAATVNNGQPCLGHKMVTHSWRNKFSNLLAAILADALGAET